MTNLSSAAKVLGPAAITFQLPVITLAQASNGFLSGPSSRTPRSSQKAAGFLLPGFLKLPDPTPEFAGLAFILNGDVHSFSGGDSSNANVDMELAVITPSPKV
ncbi:hypothetical protein DFH07DRAFT_969262 [Mycena maculata]|uniref:Uncharacterized protein n=1 Tax=Mycena maculata TaxID=230809 RepID=A0AAD7HX35_9AGAR|nr:hypothetical protein DFH07DRAFT_969262 [Mycena maculata]